MAEGAGQLARLEVQALLDNVDASARIDGICLDPSRIQQLIDGAEPTSARERQIVGYARTLKAFQKGPDRFPIDAASRKLMMIPTFAVDVMCIKPFDEGTGRLARLFSLLLMEKVGFDVGCYVSIDRLCERHAAAYYEALNECLGSWDVQECDYSPFVGLWLSLVSEAYRMLLALVENAPAGTPSKAQQVRDLFAFRNNLMTKAQVVAALPDVSLSTVENVLRALAREGWLEKIGAGRSTAYLRK